MKILLFTDNHFCERASIVNKIGNKYTIRLENQIESINYVEQIAKDTGCAAVFCLGDFFDRAYLTDQELTALRDIAWNDLPHYFIVGNHEIERSDLKFNSVKALEGPNRQIISEAKMIEIDGTEIAFLPYVVESDRKPLTEYFPVMSDKPRLLLSHNDIAGIRLGPVVSKHGFSIDELDANCTYCINGHLHNGQKISDKVINLGNLTGKDFGEDAKKYSHRMLIIDLADLSFEFIENKNAFNFYTLRVETEADLKQFDSLKRNAVLRVSCKEKLVEDVRRLIAERCDTIIVPKVIVIKDLTADDNHEDISELMVNPHVKFAEFIRDRLESTKILEEELAEVLKLVKQ